jgi:hypothetical protein
MESTADWPVEGVLVHVAGQTEKGFRVVDVWKSEDAFRRFGEKLMPIMKEVGIEGAPEIYQAPRFRVRLTRHPGQRGALTSRGSGSLAET